MTLFLRISILNIVPDKRLRGEDPVPPLLFILTQNEYHGKEEKGWIGNTSTNENTIDIIHKITSGLVVSDGDENHLFGQNQYRFVCPEFNHGKTSPKSVTLYLTTISERVHSV